MKKVGFLKIAIVLMAIISVVSCSKDDDTYVDVTVNGTLLVGDRSDFNGDIDASFKGNGGSASRTFSWNNRLNTADYNADITSNTEGSFQIIVKDSEGVTVLDRTIDGGTEPDTIGGLTSSGSSGIWTVTIQVTNFNGDGSFSLSEGN
ncbi:hypothetical protein [Cellulophaga sp. Hel_I_12]|uniref:hypothetical protein n=1 Tax=Cellulophaga sp. Hel_I_12 TaxID=1249972 RepID=UPI000645A2FE|nr:hypothetical protein [Cellulophaga sp. Hel_I_12]